MTIFWTPDEDERPRGGSWTSRAVADEVARWIDQRAVRRLGAAVGAFTQRIAARAQAVRRLRHRPTVRHRRVT